MQGGVGSGGPHLIAGPALQPLVVHGPLHPELHLLPLEVHQRLVVQEPGDAGDPGEGGGLTPGTEHLPLLQDLVVIVEEDAGPGLELELDAGDPGGGQQVVKHLAQDHL